MGLLEPFWWLFWCSGINILLNIYGVIGDRFPAVKEWDMQFDFKKTFFDKEPFCGSSTTWGGFLLVLIFGLGASFFFSSILFLILSILVFVGHAIGAFIKRRFHIPRGKFLPFIDHGDYVLVAGGWLVLHSYIEVIHYVLAYGVVIILTPFITYGAHTLKLRRDKL